MARITVIIPAYNAAGRLDECIDSIERQTFGDWEIVACDDASTDETWELLQQWAAKDGRIKLLRNEKNLRAAATRNRCLERAAGEYIALQDADDYSSPGRLEKELKFLEEHGEYAFVGAAMACFDERGIWQRLVQKAMPSRWDFIWRPPFNHAAVLFRKSALDAVRGYRVAKETARGQDLDLFMRLYAAGFKGYNLPETLYFYNEDRANFSRRKYRYRIDEAKIRLRGYRAMGIMPWGIIGVLKPLAVGLIPAQLMKRLKRWLYVVLTRIKGGKPTE
jgi:glycosyltransferase involved in cell wall biosynthesis